MQLRDIEREAEIFVLEQTSIRFISVTKLYIEELA